MPYHLVTNDLISPDYQIQDQDGNVIAVFVCPLSRPEVDGETVLKAAQTFVVLANLVEQKRLRTLRSKQNEDSSNN